MKPSKPKEFKIIFLRLAREEDSFFREFNIDPGEATKECVLRHISIQQLMYEKRSEREQYEAQKKMEHERGKSKVKEMQDKKQRKFNDHNKKGEISIPGKYLKSMERGKHDLISSGAVKKLPKKKNLPVCKKCSITLKRLSPDVIKKYEKPEEIAPKKCFVSLKRLTEEVIKSYQKVEYENKQVDVLADFDNVNDIQYQEAEQESQPCCEWFDVLIYRHACFNHTAQILQKERETDGTISLYQKRKEDDIKLLHIVEYPQHSLRARKRSPIIIEEMEEDSDIEIIEEAKLDCRIQEPSDESRESSPGTSGIMSGKK